MGYTRRTPLVVWDDRDGLLYGLRLSKVREFRARKGSTNFLGILFRGIALFDRLSRMCRSSQEKTRLSGNGMQHI